MCTAKIRLQYCWNLSVQQVLNYGDTVCSLRMGTASSWHARRRSPCMASASSRAALPAYLVALRRPHQDCRALPSPRGPLKQGLQRQKSSRGCVSFSGRSTTCAGRKSCELCLLPPAVVLRLQHATLFMQQESKAGVFLYHAGHACLFLTTPHCKSCPCITNNAELVR